jgi:hypothetical protein
MSCFIKQMKSTKYGNKISTQQLLIVKSCFVMLKAINSFVSYAFYLSLNTSSYFSKITFHIWKESVNAPPKVVGFLRMLRFPPTWKIDRVGQAKHSYENNITIVVKIK